MANRPARAADVANPLYADWIADQKLCMYRGRTMQVGDWIFDSKTNATSVYYNLTETSTSWNEALLCAASGNTAGSPTLTVKSTISTDRPQRCVVRVNDGTNIDYYAVQSCVGTTITLDTTEHPGGLIRTYAEDVDLRLSYFRRGLTVWVDAAAYGMDISDPKGTALQSLRVAYDADQPTNTGWPYLTSFSEPAAIFPLRGQVILTDNRVNGTVLEFPFNNLYVDGNTKDYPGMVAPFTTSPFLHGTFGFIFWDLWDSMLHGMTWDKGYLPGTSVEVTGTEAIGGFDGCRVGINGSGEVELFAYYGNCPHDGKSEGIYIGKTSGVSIRMKRVLVENNVIARRGTEPIQVEETINNAYSKAYQYNSILQGAAEMLAPFAGAQDNAFQINFGDGSGLVTKNITIGWGGNAIIFFGNNVGTGQGEVKIVENLFSHGYRLMYIHNSTAGLSNIKVKVHNNYLFDYLHRKAEIPDDSDPEDISQISSNNGGMQWEIIGMVSDNSVLGVINDDNTIPKANFIVDNEHEKPAYNNLGLDYGLREDGHYDYALIFSPYYYNGQSNSKYIQTITDNGSGEIRLTTNAFDKIVDGGSVVIDGTANHNGYYQNAIVKISGNVYDIAGSTFAGNETFTNTAIAFTPRKYYTGEIVNINDPDSDYGFTFWQCNADFECTGNDSAYPYNDPTNWTRVWWDINGVRSDKPGYTTPYSNFPPDDCRLTDDSFFGSRDYGVLPKIRTGRTYMEWLYSVNGNEFYPIPLSSAKKMSFKPVVTGYYKFRIVINGVEFLSDLGLITI